MNKLLYITLLIGLLAETFIDSGEAVIRAGRNMLPYEPPEQDADVMREMYERAKRPKYFKRYFDFFQCLNT